MCVFALMSTSAHGVQKRASDSLELEEQAGGETSDVFAGN